MENLEHLDYCYSTELFGNYMTNYIYSNHILHLVGTKSCPYCGSMLSMIKQDVVRAYFDEDIAHEIFVCPSCNWWRKHSIPDHYFNGYVYIGVLHRTFHIDVKLKQAIDRLLQDQEIIYQLDPTYFEKLVGDILKEYYDCEMLHHGKSHDGGIDVFLLDSNQGIIPIQVKRRTKKEKVESVTIVRELRGAMVVTNHSKGMIVTTAHHFSKEAIDISEPKPEHAIPQKIELIDCRRLLDIMGVIREKTKRTIVIPNDNSMRKLLIEEKPKMETVLNLDDILGEGVQ